MSVIEKIFGGHAREIAEGDLVQAMTKKTAAFAKSVASGSSSLCLASKTWIVQATTIVFPMVFRFFCYLSRNAVAKAVANNIKKALEETWAYLKALSLKQKFIHGVLLGLGLWTGIFPWIVKIAMDFSLTMAGSLFVAALPLSLLAGIYFLCQRGAFVNNCSSIWKMN
jgi:hypothetical protein